MMERKSSDRMPALTTLPSFRSDTKSEPIQRWKDGFRRFNLHGTIVELGTADDLNELIVEYGILPPDRYDALGTRFRRYARALYFPWSKEFRWLPEPANEHGEALSPYYQDGHNPEHVGKYRYFPTISDKVRSNPALQLTIFSALSQTVWEAEDARYPVSVGVHMIAQRVTEERPVATVSPNCMHQDGEVFDYVILIARHGVTGGKSCIAPVSTVGRMVDAMDLEPGTCQFTLQHPLEGFGVRDEFIAHGVSEVRLAPGFSEGYRYTLLVDTAPMREWHRPSWELRKS